MHTPSETVAHIFEFGLDVTASTLDGEGASNPSAQTGTILLQVGSVASNRVDSQLVEQWGIPGVLGRPAPPSAGQAACQVVALKRGNHWIGFCYRDLRANDVYANLAPGETALYATVGQAREVAKADGSVRQYTTDDNTKTGRAIYAGVGSLYQGIDGSEHEGGEWRVYAPWGGQWQDPTGYHLRTWQGVKVDAGGMTVPFPGGSKSVATYTLTADAVKVLAGVVVLGSSAGAQPVVLAQSLATVMGSFASSLSTFSSALSTFVGAVGTFALAVPGASAPAGVLNAACGAMIAATTAFATTVSGLMSTLLQTTGANHTTAA